MSRPVLHQISVGAVPGDAITDHVLVLQRWLRDMGFISEIYAEHIHPALGDRVHPLTDYRPRARERSVIYHHSIGSSVAGWLSDRSLQVVLVYHNVTPPEYFRSVDPALADQMVQGRRQLSVLRDQTILALGVSPYNVHELESLGFAQTGVLPLTLDEGQYAMPSNPDLLSRLQCFDPLLLFVGRQVPNKRQEDLIKLLYYCRRVRPHCGLALVGGAWMAAYEKWLHEFADDLGLGGAVAFMGHVSQRDMITCYRRADLYVSMSEHEGFGKPFIESMYLDLPILAYAAAGVPSTLDGSGVLFRHKDYEALAEVVDWMVNDGALLDRIRARQRERVQAFLEPRVRCVWQDIVGGLVNAGLSAS